MRIEREYSVNGIKYHAQSQRSLPDAVRHPYMLLQLADNDEIEAVTGKRRSDSSVVKRQMYVNQRRKKHDWK